MPLVKMKRIGRDYVRANPDKIFLFGDNLSRKGFGGQALAMRGEPNAFGIATKKTPTMREDAFFTDAEFSRNVRHILNDFVPVFTKAVEEEQLTVVIPEDGLGTGLAQLEKRAPMTFKYLEIMIENLRLLLEPAQPEEVL